MMKLNEFVKQSILQIADGLNQAIADAPACGIKINPTTGRTGETSTINFSVNVVAEGKGGLDIKVLDLGASVSAASKIDFSVKVQLPCMKDEYKPVRPTYDNAKVADDAE